MGPARPLVRNRGRRPPAAAGGGGLPSFHPPAPPGTLAIWRVYLPDGNPPSGPPPPPCPPKAPTAAHPFSLQAQPGRFRPPFPFIRDTLRCQMGPPIAVLTNASGRHSCPRWNGRRFVAFRARRLGPSGGPPYTFPLGSVAEGGGPFSIIRAVRSKSKGGGPRGCPCHQGRVAPRGMEP